MSGGGGWVADGRSAPSGTPIATPARISLPRTLRLVSRRHDLVAIRIVDAAETELPDAGLVVMRDPETGRETAIDTSRAGVRDRYRGQVGAQERALRATFRRLAIDEIEVATGGSYVKPLMGFFRARERKLHR